MDEHPQIFSQLLDWWVPQTPNSFPAKKVRSWASCSAEDLVEKHDVVSTL